MAQAHHHHGESMRDYFTEQLLTICVCGLFGFVAIEMYVDNRLSFLDSKFHNWVLGGGIGIMTMVLLRAISVWKEAGKYQGSGHAHGPNCEGVDCNHVHIPGDEEHTHDHDHGHSHDMSWVIARMLILVFPVALFFLGLPNSTFSAEEQLKRAGRDTALATETLEEYAKDAAVEEQKYDDNGQISYRVLKTKTGLKLKQTFLPNGKSSFEVLGGEPIRVKFSELNDAAYNAGERDFLQGQTAILEGRFKRLADKEFTLFRMKMTCCKADEVPLKVRIIVPQALSNFNNFDWVKVKGQIQFLKIPNQEQYVPVLLIAHVSDVVKGEAPSNESE